VTIEVTSEKDNERNPGTVLPPREEAVIFADLAVLCASPGFAHAIAYFCCRDNLIRYQSEVTTGDLARVRTGNELIRTELSTLIGLLSRQPIDYTLPPSAVIEGYIDKTQALLHELHRALSSVWFKIFTPEKAKAGFDPFSDGAAMREPIFYGGDSAYYFQYREFASKKYQDDKPWIEANKGFDIATAIQVSEALGAILTDKQGAILDTLRQKHPDEWTLLPAFTFSLTELAARSGVKRELVEKVITAFCLPSGHLNPTFTSLQEFNATDAQPILHIGGVEYLLFQHYSLTEAIYEAPFFWMSADRVYARQADAHRGRFTEEFAYERLRHVFGDHVYKNVHLERAKGNLTGEIDVLVVFGDRAIVLQAKSKRLTLEARKGNDRQIKDDFRKAIQHAYDQAFVCSRALMNGSYKLKDGDGNEVKLNVPLKQIFPVCIVADHYPALAFQVRQFVRFEESEAIASPLVTDVFALDAMTEMLKTPLLLLSYLDLRRVYGKKALYVHEFSLLSAHLKCNLWIDEKYDMVSFDEALSVHLDLAMAVRREGIPGARTPKGILTRLQGTPLGSIIASIEARPDPATIDFGLQVLALGDESVKIINKGIEYIRAQSTRDRKNHDFTTSFGESSSGLTVHCNNRPKQEATDSIFRHCTLRKYSQKALSWFGLVLSPTDGSVRFGIKLEGDWKQDPLMDNAVKRMPQGMPLAKVKGALEAKRVGRNDLCLCGSGRKYKKCCLAKL
jgi:SEC-C motif/Nuclease-related domain